MSPTRFLALAVLALAGAALAQPAPVLAPAIAAPAYFLLDVSSGQPIAAEGAELRREPASLTKLMTAYLAFGALRDKTLTPSQMVNVSEAAWRAEGSRMFIEPRKAVSVDELLRGMIVQSGNDASIALAELVAGSEAAFAERMNKEAAPSRPRQHAFRQRDGALPSAALFDRRRPGPPRGGADPRLPRVLPAVFAQGISLQQHHAAESQPPAVDRPVRRRGQDRAHGRGGLVSHRLVEARAAPAAVGRPGSGVRRGANDGEPETPQLRFPGLRYGPAVRVGAAGYDAAGMERRH